MWFETLTGFIEESPQQVRSKILEYCCSKLSKLQQ